MVHIPNVSLFRSSLYAGFGTVNSARQPVAMAAASRQPRIRSVADSTSAAVGARMSHLRGSFDQPFSDSGDIVKNECTPFLHSPG